MNVLIEITNFAVFSAALVGDAFFHGKKKYLNYSYYDQQNAHHLSYARKVEYHSDFTCNFFAHLHMLLEPQNWHEFLLNFFVDGDFGNGLDEYIDLEPCGNFEWNRRFLICEKKHFNHNSIKLSQFLLTGSNAMKN